MNLAEYSLRVFERVAGGKPESESSVLRSAIELDAGNVLNELARRVYASDKRASLEKVYTATLTSGAVNLAASPFTDLWFPSMRTARVMYPEDAENSFKAEFYENPSDLDLPSVPNAYRFSLIGATLILRDDNGDAPANTNALLITASFIPVLGAALTAVNLDGDLIDIGCEYALRSPEAAQAAGAEV